MIQGDGKMYTRWLSGNWEGLSGHQLRQKLLDAMGASEVAQEKFWENVLVPDSDEECWPWISSLTPRRYGRYPFRPFPSSREKCEFRAHRIVWFLTYGYIPHDLCVCHHCDNPSCCNPHHLFVGTSPENSYDRTRKMRQAWGEGHGMHFLTAKQVRKIRHIRATQGIPYTELGKMFKVNHTTICSIVRRKSWKHLK